ncbi:putative phospholipid methyltransferase [Cocos nucifera]|uniref:Putative phospholipid methyltransferase n=1 Tax=Cocos nucifera TaxID=13894 RepID=A0A8K0I827_COCNU|nr:putative phospholipid methyltransferase [Cocos nucifera]
MGTAARFLHSPAHPLPTLPRTRLRPPASLLSSFALPSRALLLHPNSTHLFFPIKSSTKLSLRPNHKHLTPIQASSQSQFHSSPEPRTLPKPFFFLPLPAIDLSGITPLTVCKWSAVIAVALAAAKQTAALLLDPFFWTYFSIAWVFWPWLLAILLAAYGLYSFCRHSLGCSTLVEQLAIVTSTVAWLTLVPPAHFNGFLEGWPIAIFFIYYYFFFFESSVRKRLYGDLYPRPHDSKWDVGLPRAAQIGFAVFVFIGHWLAAYEGPELHLISGGWANAVTWLLVAMTLFMRYHSVLYLAKYSEKVVVPTAVVQFGPYRWVRHPIYASTMLLFALHCITLRAPLSLAYLVAVCLFYYGQKAELEEALMVETFGETYTEYMKKVRYRLIPLLY